MFVKIVWTVLLSQQIYNFMDVIWESAEGFGPWNRFLLLLNSAKYVVLFYCCLIKKGFLRRLTLNFSLTFRDIVFYPIHYFTGCNAVEVMLDHSAGVIIFPISSPKFHVHLVASRFIIFGQIWIFRDCNRYCLINLMISWRFKFWILLISKVKNI